MAEAILPASGDALQESSTRDELRDVVTKIGLTLGALRVALETFANNTSPSGEATGRRAAELVACALSTAYIAEERLDAAHDALDNLWLKMGRVQRAAEASPEPLRPGTH